MSFQSHINSDTAKTATGYMLSAGLCIMGTRCILNPSAQSVVFGIPTPSTLADKDSYVPVMGTRNLAFGLLIGAFMLRGDRKSAGVVCMSALTMAVLDTWTCARHAGKMTGAAWSHAFGDSLSAALGYWLTT